MPEVGLSFCSHLHANGTSLALKEGTQEIFLPLVRPDEGPFVWGLLSAVHGSSALSPSETLGLLLKLSVDKVSPTVYLHRKCLCRVYLHMVKGRRQGKAQWWDRGTYCNTVCSAELQALDILSHIDPQFDPAVGMMDDHPLSMTTSSRAREHLWRELLFWPLCLTLLGVILCKGTVSKNKIAHKNLL